MHQAGVFAAAASKDIETLKQTAQSKSRLMKKLAVKEVTRLTSDEELLATVLSYHVVPKLVQSKDLADGQQLETLAGVQLTVRIVGGAVSLAGSFIGP